MYGHRQTASGGRRSRPGRAGSFSRAGWPDAPLTFEPLPKSQAFLMVATNAFNYEVLDETAFRLVSDMVRCCDAYSLIYSDLDEAVHVLDKLSQAGDG